MNSPSHSARTRRVGGILAIAGAVVGLGLMPHSSGATQSVSGLSSQLQSQRAAERKLSASVSGLSTLIGRLAGQVAVIERHRAAVETELSGDQATLDGVRSNLAAERARRVRLVARLGHAMRILDAQLVSTYETDPPDVISVVLKSHGFADMLDQLTFLRDAKQQQQDVITTTRRAKAAVAAAQRRLGGLETHDQAVTNAVAAQARAVTGISTLLESREATLESARAARVSELGATRAKAGDLQHALTKLQAELASQTDQAYGSWAIPAAIVMCESGGQNLPPNSAGASGYYQFLPSTWKGEGGDTPAAYLAPKSEQDRLAAKLWNGGRGASNWDCAAIVGIG
ncbi:MAG TPA: transglycosylase family protein [Solirubrobacteraceae bacterium]|jgi:septal ring factor EnvC (AmiA/AmiB activator)|nr:transglycosylase family protein [Solirubrobacteraceae bacterium]